MFDKVSKLQQDRVMELLNSGVKEGCTVRCGGDVVKDRKGYYIQPTVLTDLRDDMKISQEEVSIENPVPPPLGCLLTTNVNIPGIWTSSTNIQVQRRVGSY